MSRKQTNLIMGIAVLVVAVFALFFPNDSNLTNSEFGPSPALEDVYEKEVLGENAQPTSLPIPTIVPQPNVSMAPDNPARGHRVVKVVDGDTFDVEIDGKVERLRLIGIDTPETVDPRKDIQCFGIEASNKAKELLIGQFVTLEKDDTQGDKDRYKRLLRYAFLPDGTNFNEYMIAEGYAYEYTYDDVYEYQSAFKSAQAEAQNNNKGLWSPDTCSGNK